MLPTQPEMWNQIDREWLVMAADATATPAPKKPAARKRKKTPAPRPTA